jgi:hypothetical protein
VTHATEYEFEGVPGLPGHLPPDEKVLWQGSPSWTHLAIRTLHVRKIWIYFALLAVWQAATLLQSGESWLTVLASARWSVLAAALATAILSLLAWSMARATIYTITSKRVVLRSGVALPMAINIPFSEIEGASVRQFSGGNGDIPLQLTNKQRLAYLVLWPNVRPWIVNHPQPMLRAIDDATNAGRILADALAADAQQLAVRPIEAQRAVRIPSGVASSQAATA